MIRNRADAKRAVLEHYNPDPDMVEIGDEFAVVDTDTRETNDLWIFHVVSRRFLESRDSRFELCGVMLVVVDKSDGAVYPLHPVSSHKARVALHRLETRPSIINRVRYILNIILDLIFFYKGRNYW